MKFENNDRSRYPGARNYWNEAVVTHTHITLPSPASTWLTSSPPLGHPRQRSCPDTSDRSQWRRRRHGRERERQREGSEGCVRVPTSNRKALSRTPASLFAVSILHRVSSSPCVKYLVAVHRVCDPSCVVNCWVLQWRECVCLVCWRGLCWC